LFRLLCGAVALWLAHDSPQRKQEVFAACLELFKLDTNRRLVELIRNLREAKGSEFPPSQSMHSKSMDGEIGPDNPQHRPAHDRERPKAMRAIRK
jgi:hypothetical protein